MKIIETTPKRTFDIVDLGEEDIRGLYEAVNHVFITRGFVTKQFDARQMLRALGDIKRGLDKDANNPRPPKTLREIIDDVHQRIQAENL